MQVYEVVEPHDIKLREKHHLESCGPRLSESWLTNCVHWSRDTYDAQRLIGWWLSFGAFSSSGSTFNGQLLDLNGNLLQAHRAAIMHMALSPDKSVLYTASSDYTVIFVLVFLCSFRQIKCWRRTSGAAWLKQCGEFVCTASCTSISVGDASVVVGDSLGNVYILSLALAPRL